MFGFVPSLIRSRIESTILALQLKHGTVEVDLVDRVSNEDFNDQAHETGDD
jgi:hypothetical protein